MTETVNLGLPLLAAAQAQKHVTVNAALTRLDGLAQLVLESVGVVTPPVAPDEGAVYAVPPGAVNAWAGEEGRLAIYVNGGWDFVTPGVGWRGFVADEGISAVFDGAVWVGAAAVSENGAGMVRRVAEVDHVLSAGATSVTGTIIPSHSIVYGVTGLVLNAITGAATSWRLGVAGVSDDRYGSGIGLAPGSWLKGITSSPVTYFADTALTLTGEGGDFTGGTVRLAVHLAEFTLPRA